MTWEFKPGMKVVCIAEFSAKRGVVETHPQVGQIYTIRDIVDDIKSPDQQGKIFIRLTEIINKVQRYKYGPEECSFWADKFRPLQTQFTSLLNSIVAGVNDGKLVVEDDKYMEKFKKSQKKKVTVR